MSAPKSDIRRARLLLASTTAKQNLWAEAKRAELEAWAVYQVHSERFDFALKKLRLAGMSEREIYLAIKPKNKNKKA